MTAAPGSRRGSSVLTMPGGLVMLFAPAGMEAAQQFVKSPSKNSGPVGALL